ncbi:hypothetical protein [Candidatus Halobonum tyrrellensis]|uniref:hypothetical protein n=1 Tax=Candidatus Halobonum tyrrellensis TaxID=1431545 RepID=UPI001377B975|nr:hypothetical protein [Candidatus Halobonum tyrrellensis]
MSYEVQVSGEEKCGYCSRELVEIEDSTGRVGRFCVAGHPQSQFRAVGPSSE